ncbi:MAG: type II secretion system F family protein [Anaerolineaceae bacterium]|nr:type II secretion system F family protein [Anaerolineaceae bacterium]
MEALQPYLPLIIAMAVLFIIGVMLYIGLRDDSGRDPLQERLEHYGINDIEVDSLEEVELSVGFKDRVFIPFFNSIANVLSKVTPQRQLESMRRQLEQAGLTTDPTQFFLQRIIFTIVLGVVGLIVGFSLLRSDITQGLAWTLGGAALGFYLPVLLLRSKIGRRQDAIQRALPDALDLLVICVEAGLGFDQAMGKVYEKWDNELALAFGRVLREIQLGKQRKVALKDMSDRMDIPDVNSFVAAIIQAEQLGVSMGKILRVQSDQMRVKRRQRAQEKAHQAPVKMMFPMVLLIFPSMWVVLLGPALLQIMDANISL